MSKNRDPLALSSHWHVDCSLADELPDDRVVSSRFLVNLPFGAITLTLMVIFGLKVSTDLSLRGFVADWNRRLAESQIQVAGIKQMQREYGVASSKIDQAYKLVHNRLSVYNFVTHLAHTRPELMVINNIETNNAGIVVRGSLGESSERSTTLIGKYVAQLNKDPEIGTHFEVNVTSFERDRATDQQGFELNFRALPNPQ